jgi:hypothetical protein
MRRDGAKGAVGGDDSRADEKFQNLPDDGCRLAIANRVLMLCITLLTGVVLVQQLDDRSRMTPECHVRI